jgi:hypothetical protein
VVDDRRQCGPASRKVGGGQLALEDGKLQMVAEPAHRLEDFAQALVIADVVADQVGESHGITAPNRIAQSGDGSFPLNTASRA